MNNLIVAPSILGADFGNLESEIKSVEESGANYLHIDVMDGNFVPPITFGDNLIKLAKSCSSLFLDVHLMVEKPEKYIDSYVSAGADRLIVHQETCPHLHRTLETIKAKGISNGVAVNPGTPVELIFDVLQLTDLVLIMSVNPGWGGQKFIHSCLSKIAEVKQEINRQNLNCLIEVDGGVNETTGKECISAGAQVLVAGSYFFNSKDRKLAVQHLSGK